MKSKINPQKQCSNCKLFKEKNTFMFTFGKDSNGKTCKVYEMGKELTSSLNFLGYSFKDGDFICGDCYVNILKKHNVPYSSSSASSTTA